MSEMLNEIEREFIYESIRRINKNIVEIENIEEIIINKRSIINLVMMKNVWFVDLIILLMIK